jgi:quinol monooxygenase YgiN
MSDLSIIHFLKISGKIAQHRKREFENTVKYACGLMPDDCLEKTLSTEIFAEDTYYFFSEWSTGPALKKFMQSEEYQLIRSAYDVLGVLHKIEIGYHVEIKTIRINH